jgi:hypothetical protein
MQLIARQGFKNNAKGYIVFGDGHETTDSNGDAVAGRHPDGVHKGARFSIGGDRELDDLNGVNGLPYHSSVIRELLTAGLIGNANDATLCKKIDAEVAAEKRQQETSGAAGDAGVDNRSENFLSGRGSQLRPANVEDRARLTANAGAARDDDAAVARADAADEQAARNR